MIVRMNHVTAQPKKPSLFYRATSWLWPTNRDSLMWLCCTLVLVGLLDPLIEQQLSQVSSSQKPSLGMMWLALAMVAGALLGVAATWAWKKLDPAAGKLVVIGSIAGCAALVYSSYLTWGISTHSTSTALSGANHEIDNLVLSAGWPLRWAAMVAVVGGVAVFIVLSIRGTLFCWKKFNTKVVSFSINRTRIMIGLAVFLLALGLIQNVFFPRGFLSNASISFAPNSVLNQVLSWVSTVIGFAAVLMASWVFATGRANFWKHLALFVLLLLGLFLVVYFGTTGSFRRAFKVQTGIVVVFGIIAFLWTATVASRQLRNPELNNDVVQNPASSQPMKWLCFWTILAILFTISATISMYFFDPMPLIASRDWKTARYARTVRARSGNQIRIGTYWAVGLGGFHDLACNLEKEVPADVFGNFSVPGLAVGTFKHLTPEIKTDTLTTLQVVAIHDSKISVSQLSDLASVPTSVHLHNVEIIDPDMSVDLNGIFVQISVDQDGRWDSMLRSINSINFGRLLVSADKELDKSELDELVRFSQRIQVPIDATILDRMIELNYSSDLPLGNLIVADPATATQSCLMMKRLGILSSREIFPSITAGHRWTNSFSGMSHF